MNHKYSSQTRSAERYRIKMRRRAGAAALWLRSTWTDEERQIEAERLEAETLEFIAALEAKRAVSTDYQTS